MTILIIVVMASLLISAMCSLFEAALFSTRLATLEAARTEGKHRALAEQMIRMKRDIAAPTSAILILNTVANTAGATLAGMYAAQVLGEKWVPIFSIALVMAILFISEILPKTYGATHWQRIWPLIVLPLTILRYALLPAVWVTQKFSRFFMRKSPLPIVTEDEVVAMIRLCAKAGQLSPSELELLYAAFHFDEVICRQIMVPREEIDVFDMNDSIEEWFRIARETQHTRYPVCRGSLDNIVGLLHIKDILGRSPDEAFDVSEIIRPLRTVPETMRISRLLREMQRNQPHMVLVVDRSRKVTGVVTLENVIEEIVGPVQDEFDEDETETLEVTADGSGRYIVGGQVLINRLNRDLGLQLAAKGAMTVSDLLLSKAGHPLEPGEVLHLDGAVFEVLEVQAESPMRIRLTL